MKNQKIYFEGTKIKVNYLIEGINKTHTSILATNFEDEFVFQVICLNDSDAGNVDGFIHSQFKNAKAVTYDFLIKELEEMVYQKIISFEILDDNYSSSIEEIENLLDTELYSNE